MNNLSTDISGLVREHIQTLDPYADIILLFPPGSNHREEIQIFVLTPGEVNYAIEQQYLNASYNIRQHTVLPLSLHVYSKAGWHKNCVDTPVYIKVQNEGLVI